MYFSGYDKYEWVGWGRNPLSVMLRMPPLPIGEETPLRHAAHATSPHRGEAYISIIFHWERF